MKVFVIAFACEPNRTSEPGVGWNVACELAKRHSVTVLTRANNRSVIEKFQAENPEHDSKYVHFEYFDLAGWFCWLKKRIPYGAQIYQEVWNFAAAKKYSRAIAEADIVHQLTFGAAFFTPYAARYTTRLVWGPIGGGDRPIQMPFLKRMGLKSLIIETIYKAATNYACKGGLWSNQFRRRVAAIIFRTNEFKGRMRDYGTRVRTSCLETAYSDAVVTSRKFNVSSRPLRVLMLGRLLPHKGVLLALEAFGRFLADGGLGELIVCGTGVLSREMQRRARQLNIANNVRFEGQIAHDKAMAIMNECDVLLHLSFREGGSWSILEAMAHGLPVVCQCASGMNDMVGDDCGVKIVAEDPEVLIADAVMALKSYWTNRELIRNQGISAQRRVSEVFQWSRIADKIDQVYSEVLNG